MLLKIVKFLAIIIFCLALFIIFFLPKNPANAPLAPAMTEPNLAIKQLAKMANQNPNLKPNPSFQENIENETNNENINKQEIEIIEAVDDKIANNNTNNNIDYELKEADNNQQSNNSLSNISVEVKQKIIMSVPFTSQAPFGDWSDSRQQDGCEEASVLMAIKWARQESLTREIALQEILAASDYILEKYGEYRDTNLDDVLNWLIYDYFNYEKAEIKKNVTLNDLISELNNGRVIIAPMNGQALKNPNFTAPGPINHMLLIRGYDPNKKTFITNDPGTRNGELYEYNENILFSALRTYPTGYHEVNNNPEKNIIVFWR